MSMKH